MWALLVLLLGFCASAIFRRLGVCRLWRGICVIFAGRVVLPFVWGLFSWRCLDVGTDRSFGGVDLWAFVMWGFSVERGFRLLELSL